VANRIKEQLARGEMVYGVWADVFDPNLIEMFGVMGYDFALLDGEHTVLDHRMASELIRAANVSGMEAVVRIPEVNATTIEKYLDLGAIGIYVPHLRTADQARAVIDAMKYRPVGHRGAASLRGLKYALSKPVPELVEDANAAMMFFGLIEDLEGVANLDEILAVDGVDIVGVGDGDLSFDMGYPGQRLHPDVRKVTLEAEARILASGHYFDSSVESIDEAVDCMARGSRIITVSIRHFLRSEGVRLLQGWQAAARASA
jgi:2-keto-3-deoxy-L-rhamnonate aldolase RhmA